MAVRLERLPLGRSVSQLFSFHFLCPIIFFLGITFISGSIYGGTLPKTELSLTGWTSLLDSAGFGNHVHLFAASNQEYVKHIAFISQASTPKPLLAEFGTPSIEDDDTMLIHHFAAGDEVQLVELVSGLDSTQPYSLWLHTESLPSNARLIGLSRTLCHEYSTWKIFTVLFDPSWDSFQQRRFILDVLLPLKLVHIELMVDKSGSMTVPRIVEAPGPLLIEPRGSRPVQLNGTQVWLQYPPVPIRGCVEVAISFVSLSPVFPGFSEFSGTVTAVGQDNEDIAGKR